MPAPLTVLCISKLDTKTPAGFSGGIVKWMNPTCGFDHRSDFCLLYWLGSPKDSLYKGRFWLGTKLHTAHGV